MSGHEMMDTAAAEQPGPVAQSIPYLLDALEVEAQVARGLVLRYELTAVQDPSPNALPIEPLSRRCLWARVP
jgi:hypothetical protein